MAKKIKKIIRLHVAAGAATPAPPVGPSLAQHGVNIGEFCKKFNDLTKEKIGFKLPVDITVFEDRSYDIQIHEPSASALLRKAASIEKGSANPNTVKVGKITKEQLAKIARQKMVDLNTKDPHAASNIIAGTARNMGIVIE